MEDGAAAPLPFDAAALPPAGWAREAAAPGGDRAAAREKATAGAAVSRRLPRPAGPGFLDGALAAHAAARRWCAAGGGGGGGGGGSSGAGWHVAGSGPTSSMETELICSAQLDAVRRWSRERLADATRAGAAGKPELEVAEDSLIAPLLSDCDAHHSPTQSPAPPVTVIRLLEELRGQREMHRRVCSTLLLCARSLCGRGGGASSAAGGAP